MIGGVSVLTGAEWPSKHMERVGGCLVPVGTRGPEIVSTV